MTRKIAAAGLSIPLFLSAAMANAADEKRGFYLDVGLGAANVSYGDDEVDDSLDQLDDMGFDRTTLSLDLAMGGAVLPNLYVVGSITGFADRLDNDDEDLQLNTYLLGVGVRYYPLPSQKHLQLGVDVGLAKMAIDTSVDEYDGYTSDSGTGLKLSVAWDFDSTLRGPAFLLGVQYMAASVEDADFKGASLFARFLLK